METLFGMQTLTYMVAGAKGLSVSFCSSFLPNFLVVVVS